MNIEVFSKLGNKSYNIPSPTCSEIISKISDELEPKDIDKVSVTETYVHLGIEEVDELKEKIKLYSQLTSATIKLTNIMEYTFEVNAEGELLDIYGLIYLLGIESKFVPVNVYIKVDIALIKAMYEHTDTNYEFKYSLILRYLSNRNGNLGLSYINDSLRSYDDNEELKKYLMERFMDVYEISVDDIKIERDDSDKLSLSNLNLELLDSIGDELRRLLG